MAAYPNFDLTFHPYTDASSQGLGAILALVQEGKERMICCSSQSTDSS